MIYKKTIGNFELTVSDPTPRWVTIEHEDGQPFTFNEGDLPDLEYLVKCALRECENK